MPLGCPSGPVFDCRCLHGGDSRDSWQTELASRAVTKPTVRGALAAAVRDGRPQRHARQLLGRRALRRLRRRRRSTVGACSRRAPRSSTSAASRRDPARAPVALEEELARVVPVLEGLDGVPLSIDTSKAEVARRALALGAELVNDVTALRGDRAAWPRSWPRAAHTCVSCTCRAHPRTMQVAPHYDDVVADVLAFLEERVAFAVERGIPEERICVDPGIGFGKTPDQNLELLRRLDELRALGRPLARRRSRARARSARCSATTTRRRVASRRRSARPWPRSIAAQR